MNSRAALYCMVTFRGSRTETAILKRFPLRITVTLWCHHGNTESNRFLNKALRRLHGVLKTGNEFAAISRGLPLLRSLKG